MQKNRDYPQLISINYAWVVLVHKAFLFNLIFAIAMYSTAVQADEAPVRDAFESRVQTVLKKLSAASQQDIKVRVEVSQDPRILAYAQLRGDIRIVIGQSFGEPLDESQLAFTLAHELTHILGQHYQRSVAKHKEINSQVSGNPALSATAVAQIRNAFRRTLELEADRNAAQWLLRAGYSLANVEQLIQQLPEATGFDEGSYPTRKERLASIR